MPESPGMPATLATQPASRRERIVSCALVSTLALASLASLTMWSGQRWVSPSFIVGFASAAFVTDAVVASLLFALFWADGRRSIVLAGVAYGIDAVLVVPYAIAFPGVADVSTFANQSTSATLWLIWHLAFPVLLAAGTIWDRRLPLAERSRSLVHALTAIAVASAATIAIVSAARDRLPALVHDGHFTTAYAVFAFGVAAITVVAVLVLVRSRHLSVLTLWLAVALAASVLDMLLNGATAARYSAAWYVGKTDQFVTALVMLVSLLAAWSNVHEQLFRTVARLSRLIEYGRILRDEFERETRVSSALQVATLPRALPSFDGVRLWAAYRSFDPDASVGGDWYDAFRHTDGRLVLSVGDVMGHGLDAAVLMNSTREAIRGAAFVNADPQVILDAVDASLRSERPDAIVTAFVAIVDPRERKIAYASAGHPPAALRSSNGSVRYLDQGGLPLGLRDELGDTPQTHVLTVDEGAMLVLYTDGLTESTRDPIEGERLLRDLLTKGDLSHGDDPASLIAERLYRSDHDDMALIVVSFVAERAALAAHGVTWTFDARDGSAAAGVRRAIGGVLDSLHIAADDIAITELLFAELVGNVVRHAGTDADVVLDVSAERATLHVLDRGPGFQPAGFSAPRTLAESGRGLQIVAAVAWDFTVSQRDGGGCHARIVLPFAVAAGVNGR